MLALMTLWLWCGDANESFVAGKQRLQGFYDLYWEEARGKLFLGIDRFDEPFLFVESIATGLGSNDLLLDRGQLGRNRVVAFHRVGDHVYLEQPNLDYRALSDNAAERRAVAESFASSTLWGAKIVAEAEGVAFVDLTDFLMRDEKGIARRLAEANEGDYRLDSDRCYVFMERTRAFPDNSEMEMVLTFKGQAKADGYVRDVTPSPEAISLRQHYSFIRLPDDGYRPRRHHLQSGGFPMTFRDYAAPLNDNLERRWVFRHRLLPGKPLIYYVDPGAPPEIRQALIEGASWWEQAFAAAGHPGIFKVALLPADADPLDVRYNVIQWVHRATRGWSYGSSIADPRTGEIIKGHVTLGSLRVRHDRLLFEAMIPVAARGETDPVALALARIRQLSAHEVGHTLGLDHNFAASSKDRASVMDYPAPFVRLVDDRLDFSQVYGVGVGAWDRHATRYLYGDFDDEEQGLTDTLAAARAQGLTFVGDLHSRPDRSMHPDGNLWDNGADAIAEFERIVSLRRHLLTHFSEKNLAPRQTPAELEEMLVPLYLFHRYQLSACAKSVGGAVFDYGDNDGTSHFERVPAARQRQALNLLLSTLDATFLDLPEHLHGLIPPRPPGYPEHRELFARRTAPAFDEIALAESAVELTLGTLLVPERLNRLYNQNLVDEQQPGVDNLVAALLAASCRAPERRGRAAALHRLVNYRVVAGLGGLVQETTLQEDARASVLLALAELAEELKQRRTDDSGYRAQYRWLADRIGHLGKANGFPASDRLAVPPGSPIGMDP